MYKMSQLIMKNHTIQGDSIVQYINGHTKETGCDANQEKNPIYIGHSGKRYIECSGSKFIIIDEETNQRIFELEEMFHMSLTWFIMSNGYAATHIEGKTMYLHQLLMGYYGNGKGIKQESIDHINRDKLDNRMSNLRIVDCKTQHSNAKGIIPGTKRSRKQNAQPLPEGITEEMMPKYVVYYSEIYNKETGAIREFFRVEKHPNQTKDISTSKSNKITILQKLEEAKQIIYKLENNEGNDTLSLKSNEIEPGFSLPKYFCRTLQHGKNALSFDRKLTDGRRINIKITIKDGETYKNAVERLTMNIKQKYNEDEIETILN